ncbi:MAG: hypothetical protein O7F74_12275 [Bacteroidetes bacterium]|nr:hypothetical protein [Bacteroidota bacterium]
MKKLAFMLLFLSSISYSQESLIFKNVWYRGEQKAKGIIGYESRGRLEVTNKMLIYDGKRKSFQIPLTHIINVQVGPMYVGLVGGSIECFLQQKTSHSPRPWPLLVFFTNKQ